MKIEKDGQTDKEIGIKDFKKRRDYAALLKTFSNSLQKKMPIIFSSILER